MENENTMLYPVKLEVCDNPDNQEHREHNPPIASRTIIDQPLAAYATCLQGTKMEGSYGENIDMHASKSADIQVKVEPQELETDLHHEQVGYGTCLPNAKMEYPMGDDIDLEATEITPSCDNEHNDYSAPQIKIETQGAASDPEQDMSEDTLDQHESSSPRNVVKKENVPFSMKGPESAALLEKPDETNVDRHSDALDDSSANQSKRVYADGILFDIRVVDDACRTEANNVPTEQPANSKLTTNSGLRSRETAQLDVMDSIKSLGENKQYKCDRCEKSFCDKMELKIHKRNHQFTVCPVCKRTMRTDFVKRHIARVHPDDGILPRNRSFPCDECDRVFSNDVQLKNHQLSHKKQGCPVCGKIVRSDYLKRHMDLNHPKEVNSSDGSTYSCDQCDTVLSNKYLLFFHKRTHQTEECPVCKETLRTGYMKIHIDMKHPDHSTLPENPAFKCDQCEKSFGYKAALTLHKRKHRLTECPVCTKTVRADCLKRHMDFNHPNDTSPSDNVSRLQCDPESGAPRLSNDRRAQQTEDCPECKETFRSDYLKIHIAMKHPNDSALPEDRPFQCDQCDKSFCYKTQLRLHKRNHRLTECTICQKSMRLDCLRLHMSRMHPNTASSVNKQH
ncbi:zinc finger protein 425-like [Anopheles funestus]|uniref:zinc finger protein 425-like n=1 Tax=Anopheles funestus TaxID=62324 RepID=UPI0020C6AE49|nr:zinc finger protein 425-like [Anopheles funestus]